MIFLLSPAKTLDYSDSRKVHTTQVRFDKEAAQLVSILKKKGPDELSAMMHISRELAIENANRFRAFQAKSYTEENAKPAILAFKGQVYHGLKVEDFDEKELDYLQKHLRILSGLYGLLRPFDLMQPYRLEMGSALDTKKGKDLYTFWGDKISKLLNKDLAEQGDQLIINLASQEYFKSVKKDALKAKVINIHFKEKRDDSYKIISVYAKTARGMMVHFAARCKVSNPEQLQAFDYEGYAFNEALSGERDYVFTR